MNRLDSLLWRNFATISLTYHSDLYMLLFHVIKVDWTMSSHRWSPNHLNFMWWGLQLLPSPNHLNFMTWGVQLPPAKEVKLKVSTRLLTWMIHTELSWAAMHGRNIFARIWPFQDFTAGRRFLEFFLNLKRCCSMINHIYTFFWICWWTRYTSISIHTTAQYHWNK